MSELRALYTELVTQVVEAPEARIVPDSTGYREEAPRDRVTEGAEVSLLVDGERTRVFLNPSTGEVKIFGGRLDGQTAVLSVGGRYTVGYFNGDPGQPETFGNAKDAAAKILRQVLEIYDF